jgi:tetratricopeptide (TPR) repeat protein
MLDESIAAGQKAIELDPAYSDAYAYLAEAYADRNRPDRALEMARKAVELNENSWLAQRNLAYAFEHQGKYKTAVDTYRRAIELFPNMGILYLEMAQNLRQVRANAEADAALLKASDLDPSNPEIHDSIGRNLYDRGKLAQARFKRAIEVDPSYALGFAHLGWTYYAQRQYEEAIPNFEEAIKKGATNNEFNYELGLSYAFLLQCDKANIWLDKALANEPDSEPAHQGKILCESSK